MLFTTSGMAGLVLLAGLAGNSQAATDAAAEAEKLFNAGTFYWYGMGEEPPDPERACVLFEQAAGLHHLRAIYNLATCYRLGVGKPHDLSEAVRLYEQGADAGEPASMLALAVQILEEGWRDKMPRAVHLLQEVIAMLRDTDRVTERSTRARASLALGTAFYSGHGVPKDDQRAIELYDSAAADGNVVAQALLSEIYSGHTDYEVKADPERAEYYRELFRFETQVKGGPDFGGTYTIEQAIEYLRNKGLGLPKSETAPDRD